MSLCTELELNADKTTSHFIEEPSDHCTQTFFYGLDLKDNRLFHVSSSARKVTGYSNSEIIKNGLNWFVNQIHPDDLKHLTHLSDATHADDIVPHIKYRFRDKHDEYCSLFENRCLLYDSDGTPSFLIGRIEKA